MKTAQMNKRHNDPAPVKGDHLYEVVCGLPGGGTKRSGPMSVEEAGKYYHAAHVANRMHIDTNEGVPMYTNIMLQPVNQY